MVKRPGSIAISTGRSDINKAEPVKGEAELLERIKRSSAFQTSTAQGRLLQFLYDNRFAGLVANDIEIRHYKRTTMSNPANPAHTRERISDLRSRLEAYAASATFENIICWLPEPSATEGYQLSFRPASRAFAHQFWMPHLHKPENNVVLTGSPLFWENRDRSAISIFPDITDRYGLPQDRQSLHPEVDFSKLIGRQNLYYAAGEIAAYDRLAEWFFKETRVFLKRKSDLNVIPKNLDHEPSILIGGPSSNIHIKNALNRDQGSKLAYRLHPREGTASIDFITDRERTDLDGVRIQEDGLIGPISEEHLSFGVVARIFDEWSKVTKTIIMSDEDPTTCLSMANALTSPEEQGGLAEQMKWPGTMDLPASFEMLFQIHRGKYASEAKLLTWRDCSKAT
jgi:hypothetical protein